MKEEGGEGWRGGGGDVKAKSLNFKQLTTVILSLAI